MKEEVAKIGTDQAGEAGLETLQTLGTGDRYAVIAGNGRFPFLVLDAARDRGIHPLVVAIKEEAFPELGRSASEIEWLSLGEVARLLELLTERKINKVVLAGQVKHVQLYSSIKPDGVVEQTLSGMDRKNTDALIGVFVSMLEARGIQVVDSTLFLKPLLAAAGEMSERAPDAAKPNEKYWVAAAGGPSKTPVP